MNLFDFDAEWGVRALAGVDEAGRGPLAGPVCAACVILPQGLNIPGVNDSKKLSEAAREALFPQIVAKASYCKAVLVNAPGIDRLNIRRATLLAMREAAREAQADLFLVDGRDQPLPAGRAVVAGDSLSLSIACASIIAKVVRDRLMCRYDEIFPHYGFARHKGYDTALHRERLLANGPCALHRRSFVPELTATRVIPREGPAYTTALYLRRG